MICILRTHHKYYFPTQKSNIVFHTQIQYDTMSAEHYLVPLNFEARTCQALKDLSFQRRGEIHNFLFVLIPAFVSVRVT